MIAPNSSLRSRKAWQGWRTIPKSSLAMCGLLVFAGCGAGANEHDVEIESHDVSETPSANVHFNITAPVEIARIANEWEPQQALILSISFAEAMEDLETARNVASILDVAHPYLDIYVFGDQEEHQHFAHFLSLLSHHPRIESIMEKTTFVDSRRLFRWARDFGPIFGFNTDNRLVAIDLIYRNLMKPLQEAALNRDEPLMPLRDLYDLHGDAMPAEVAAMIQTEFDVPVDIVRPPVSMDGGDFITDGHGNIFISRQSLVRNGGDRDELESAFQRYFGARRLHILEALPGRTVPHLDMIVKFLDEETIALPDLKDYKDEEDVNPYHTQLNRAARSAIDKNERYLRKRFPDYKILKVPMPPILFKSREEITREAKEKFVRAYAVEKELVDEDIISRLTDAQLADLERQVITAIQKELPSARLDTPGAFDAVLRHYGQLPLEAYIDRYSEPGTRYRSYINSVFLHAKDGRQAFLVPRFTSSDPTESSSLKQWETETESAYQSIWPDSKIYWINCDSMVSELGFLHCATITVPLLEAN